MTQGTPFIPQCFGILEEVFPMGEDGLRHSPQRCLDCEHKTACLKFCLQDPQDGAVVREERVDRAYDGGSMSFLERWSKKKHLHRKRQKAQSPRSSTEE